MLDESANHYVSTKRAYGFQNLVGISVEGGNNLIGMGLMWQPKLGVDMSRVPITTGAPDYIWMQILKLPLNNTDHQ